MPYLLIILFNPLVNPLLFPIIYSPPLSECNYFNYYKTIINNTCIYDLLAEVVWRRSFWYRTAHELLGLKCLQIFVADLLLV